MKKIFLALFVIVTSWTSAQAAMKIPSYSSRCYDMADLHFGLCTSSRCKDEKGGLTIGFKKTPVKTFKDPEMVTRILSLLKFNSSLPQNERKQVCVDIKGEIFQLR